jgi:hypothetical protein
MRERKDNIRPKRTAKRVRFVLLSYEESLIINEEVAQRVRLLPAEGGEAEDVVDRRLRDVAESAQGLLEREAVLQLHPWDRQQHIDRRLLRDRGRFHLRGACVSRGMPEKRPSRELADLFESFKLLSDDLLLVAVAQSQHGLVAVVQASAGNEPGLGGEPMRRDGEHRTDIKESCLPSSRKEKNSPELQLHECSGLRAVAVVHDYAYVAVAEGVLYLCYPAYCLVELGEVGRHFGQVIDQERYAS